MIPLLDLTPRMCRWPVGYTDQHLFCGHERASGDTCYCPAHRAESVNASLMEKVRKREVHYQRYMAGADRFSQAA